MTILPDVLADNLEIVFCGTAAGHESARRGAYYAGRGNRFWPTLFAVGLVPRLFQPEEYRDVLAYGLGLTDLVKSRAGVDAEIPSGDFARHRLREVIAAHRPRIVAFTSKRAAREFVGTPVGYGPRDDAGSDTRLFVLPSPSGAARRYWQIEPWQALARLRRASATAGSRGA